VFYEWDNRKYRLNRRKHGLALGDGVIALEDPHRVDWIDEQLDYGEERECALGISGGRLLYVGFVLRPPDTCRLISVRKATPPESQIYHACLA